MSNPDESTAQAPPEAAIPTTPQPEAQPVPTEADPATPAISPEQEIERLKHELQLKNDEIQKIREDADEKLNQINQKIQETENRYSSLENEFSNLENKYSSLQNEIPILEEKYSNIQKEISILENKKNEIQHDIDKEIEYQCNVILESLNDIKNKEEKITMFLNGKKNQQPIITTKEEKNNNENNNSTDKYDYSGLSDIEKLDKLVSNHDLNIDLREFCGTFRSIKKVNEIQFN